MCVKERENEQKRFIVDMLFVFSMRIFHFYMLCLSSCLYWCFHLFGFELVFSWNGAIW